MRTALLRRAAALTLPVLAFTATPPAHADPITAVAEFEHDPKFVKDSRGRVKTVYLCAFGSAYTLFISGSWTMTVTGTRANGTTYTATASNSGVPNFPKTCLGVPLNGTSDADIKGTLDYQGVGGEIEGHATGSYVFCRDCPAGPQTTFTWAECSPATFDIQSGVDLDGITEVSTMVTQNQC
jgi:hypothetical protein